MNLSGNTFVALAADGRLFGLDPQLLFDAAVTAVNVFILFLLLTFIPVSYTHLTLPTNSLV